MRARSISKGFGCNLLGSFSLLHRDKLSLFWGREDTKMQRTKNEGGRRNGGRMRGDGQGSKNMKSRRWEFALRPFPYCATLSSGYSRRGKWGHLQRSKGGRDIFPEKVVTRVVRFNLICRAVWNKWCNSEDTKQERTQSPGTCCLFV